MLRIALLTTLGIVLLAASAPAAELSERFAQPRPEYGPVPIWWWSGDPIEPGRVTRQLEMLASGGISNAIILNLAPSGPLYGSAADEPPFLTDAWWKLFGHAIAEAKRVGVRIWFYDQLGFSGSGLQSRVVRDHPEFRGIELRRGVRDVDGPAEVDLAVPPEGTALAAFTARRMETPDRDPARWIWDREALHVPARRHFRRTFELDELPAKAEVRITCDNGYVLYVNAQKVGEEATSAGYGWRNAETYDVLRHLRVGRNVVAVTGEDVGPPGGLLMELVLSPRAETKQAGAAITPRRIPSDDSFRVSAEAPDGWTTADFDDSRWAQAHIVATPPAAPWGVIGGLGSSLAWLGTPIENVQEVTDRLQDGRLRVSLPEGPHRVQVFYTVPGGFDYHNAGAGAALIDVVHGEMERRFKDELGKTIAGSFQDEFPPMPRFSKRMLEIFPKRCGYELLRKLPALFDDVTDRFGDKDGPTTIRVRCDATRVAAELCEDAFFLPLHQWHERFKMLCGYDQTVRNADPIGGEGYYVDYFKTMRHYTVPGNDQSGDAKPHQSIADLYERPRVWMEGFHSSGWGQTPEELITLLHAWMAEGSTLYNPHAIYYSTHGSFYEWAPPDTGWRQPYFAHYKVLSDYVARLSYLLTRGRHVADVAVLHPAATVHAYAGFSQPLPAAQRASEVYWAAQNALRAERIDYIIIDEDSIGRAKIEDGVLSVGDARIRMLVVPAARVVDGDTVKRLHAFATSGGTVVLLGESLKHASDAVIGCEEFRRLRSELLSRGIATDDPARVPVVAVEKFGRDLARKLPYLHRKLQDRDLYFILSDDGTPATWSGQYDINGRRLWETPAGKGERLSIDIRSDGIPEAWDALTGRVLPIHNYIRHGGRTRLEVELRDSPAMLVSIRPARPDEPSAIESDLQITEWKRDGEEAVIVRGWPRLVSARCDAVPHLATLRIGDTKYQGTVIAPAPVNIDVPGPLACRLQPTMDNRDGDFAWPPSKGPLPVEVRAFRYADEAGTGTPTDWSRPDADDSKLDTVIASYGPRAVWMGPIPLPPGESFETLAAPPGVAGQIHPVEYSLRLGINEDPIYPTALGGKGRIPEEFIDLGGVRAGDVFTVRTEVTLSGDKAHDAVLRIGGEARKRAFLNGQAVTFGADPAARVLRGPVTLRPGRNTLDLLATRATDGRLRLFYQFMPAEGMPPDPQWIWSASPSPSGWTLFSRTFELTAKPVSGAMVVALGGIHRIRLNGKLVADQGNFDPYFTSRSERYDLAAFLQVGENLLEVEAGDAGVAVGMLLDGRVTLEDGREVAFVSDASFMVGPAGADGARVPARILAGPAQGYLGETATLLLYPRPHPLPEGGWLLDQKPLPAPFDRLVYTTGREPARAGWYRFIVPPGARSLRLQAHGKANLFVEGAEVPLRAGDGGAFQADLPAPDAPRRVGALRIEQSPGFERGAALAAPIVFDVGPGWMDFGSWDELGLPHYCGGLIYTAKVAIPTAPGTAPSAPPGAQRILLDLGRVRGVADVTVNGKPCGVRLWHPYQFDISAAAKPGENTVEIGVLNTLGPHFGVGHPSWHVFENQTKSGIFGPVRVTITQPVEVRLER